VWDLLKLSHPKGPGPASSLLGLASFFLHELCSSSMSFVSDDCFLTSEHDCQTANPMTVVWATILWMADSTALEIFFECFQTPSRRVPSVRSTDSILTLRSLFFKIQYKYKYLYPSSTKKKSQKIITHPACQQCRRPTCHRRQWRKSPYSYVQTTPARAHQTRRPSRHGPVSQRPSRGARGGNTTRPTASRGPGANRAKKKSAAHRSISRKRPDPDRFERDARPAFPTHMPMP
jgi:hypothetical protein